MSTNTSTPSGAEHAVRGNAMAEPAPGTAERLDYLLRRPVVSLGEAGELTGLSRSTLLRAIDAGELPRRKVGRRVMIPTAGLLGFVGADPAAA